MRNKDDREQVIIDRCITLYKAILYGYPINLSSIADIRNYVVENLLDETEIVKQELNAKVITASEILYPNIEFGKIKQFIIDTEPVPNNFVISDYLDQRYNWLSRKGYQPVLNSCPANNNYYLSYKKDGKTYVETIQTGNITITEEIKGELCKN